MVKKGGLIRMVLNQLLVNCLMNICALAMNVENGIGRDDGRKIKGVRLP